MATADVLNQADLDDIAQQIQIKLSRLSSNSISPPGGKNIEEISSSYKIWDLRLDSLDATNIRIQDLAVDVNLWHHQITQVSNGQSTSRVIANSNSRKTESSGFEVVSIVQSDLNNGLGNKIKIAEKWIDKNIVGSPLVRLLTIPSQLLYTFWLVYENDDKIFVISKPKSFTNLHYKTLYPSQVFLETLKKETFIRGPELDPG